MNKKNVLQSIKILILGLVLSLGVSYAFAVLQGSPPAGNVAGPLNVGSSAQTKEGSLTVGTAGVGGLLSASYGFGATGPAVFWDVVEIGGIVLNPLDKLTVIGNSKMSGNLAVTGTITSNTKNVCLADGTNCPSAAASLWTGTPTINPTSIATIPGITGPVTLTGGILNLGANCSLGSTNTSCTVNKDTSILNALKVNNLKTKDGGNSPSIFGESGNLVLGGSVTNMYVNSTPNSSLKFSNTGYITLWGTADIVIDSPTYDTGSLIFETDETEEGRIVKLNPSISSGIGLKSAGAGPAKVQVGGTGETGVIGTSSTVWLAGKNIVVMSSTLHPGTSTYTPPAGTTYSRVCIENTNRVLVLCSDHGL